MPSRPAVERRFAGTAAATPRPALRGHLPSLSLRNTESHGCAEGNALLVRRYRDDDHDAVWALHNLALDSVGAHGANGPWDDDLHSIPSVYIDAAGEFLVVLVDGDIVAIGALRQSGPGQGEIKRMRVHPRFQRCGFGLEILFRLENRARELGYETLHLDTTVGQTAAQALYRCHGYMETRRTQLGPFEVFPFAKSIRPRSS